MFETIPVCQLQRPSWLAVLFFSYARMSSFYQFMVLRYDTETVIDKKIFLFDDRP